MCQTRTAKGQMWSANLKMSRSALTTCWRFWCKHRCSANGGSQRWDRVTAVLKGLCKIYFHVNMSSLEFWTSVCVWTVSSGFWMVCCLRGLKINQPGSWKQIHTFVPAAVWRIDDVVPATCPSSSNPYSVWNNIWDGLPQEVNGGVK